ncbi:uncharacterized protein Ocm [Zophobas morio]|uniref:uncharacterized protein Ocm n=1 Tax=Zophobas morio TaxID=2755281 RepID=UPI003082D5B9
MDLSVVEQLLQSTGLSCDDLLLKLQAYRSIKTKPDEPENATSNEETKEDVSVKDTSDDLTSDCLSHEETKQDVSNNDSSVILETKSSKVDCNTDNLESETQNSLECSAVSSSETVNQNLPQKSEDVQCLQPDIDGINKCRLDCDSLDDCQKNQDEHEQTSSDGSAIFGSTSICDVIMKKLTAEGQESNTPKTQNRKVRVKQITKYCNDLSNQCVIDESVKEDCNTLNKNNRSELSLIIQQLHRKNKRKIAQLCESEESSCEASPKQTYVAQKDENLSSDVQEQNRCETENETRKSLSLQEESSSDTTEKIFPGLIFREVPEKGDSKFLNNYGTESENNNGKVKSFKYSEKNLSHTLPQNRKTQTASCRYTSKKEITEDGYNSLSRSAQSELFSETKVPDNYEIQRNKTRKTVIDIEKTFNKTLLENIDNSLSGEPTLEKQKTGEESTILCEDKSPKFFFKVQKQGSCATQNENSNQIKSTEEQSNILNDCNKLVESSSKDDFELNRETNRVTDDSLSDNVCSVRKINDHDYTNPVINTDSLLEAEEASLSSDPDTERETSSLKSDDLPKSEDNLRDVLRMQLSSLRNMKKNSGLLPTFKKTIFFQNLKKKRKSCDINPGISADVDDEKESNDEEVKEKKLEENKENFSTNENSLVSLSDDTDFVIVDVTGGVDRLTPNIESANNEESMFSGITNIDNEDKEHENVPNTSEPVLENKTIPKIDETSSSSDNNIVNSAFTKINENSPQLTVRKNIAEKFTRDPGINKSVKNNEKSPFVSDSLEDFLNESAELKISYAIPKLGAEEGITENTKKCPFDNVVSNNQTPKVEHDNTQREKPKLIKAKTLAEMRRHFEKLKAIEDKSVEDKPAEEAPVQLKKKRGFKRKFLNTFQKSETKSQDQSPVEENSILNIADIRTDQDVPPRNSYILYNNKKLWVPCKGKDKCLGNVNSKTNREISYEKTSVPPSPKPEQISIRKPSLLSSLAQNKCSRVKYKPGPLCKKAALQNPESKAHWMTELKTLPKIYLEVVPEVQKPIDPSIVHLLPIFEEPVITEERANFALTALKPKNTNHTPEAFNFHVPFNNKQEKIIVRKPFKSEVVQKTSSEEKEVDPEDEISKVISDLITYVEIKELGDSMIKEDECTTDIETCNESTSKTKTRKIKRKKLELELLRLNCKVIDVATDKDDTDCNKPFCRLGCICKSLLCESVFSNHCQLVECMFGCTCPSDTPGSLTATNDFLSAHTVNHLEDKAKKNLARVEKEFTHTLIHTDNDAILVGTAKVRRSCKPPKKYTDFVGDDVFDSPRPTSVEKEPTNCKKFDLVLEKLMLDDVIPFCLYHNVHSCLCKGETEIVPSTKIREVDEIPKIRIVKTKEDQHKAWYESCARIRTVFPEYKERNKTALYKHKLRRGHLSFKGRRGPRKKQEKKEVPVKDQVVHLPESIEVQSDINKSSPKIIKKPSKRKQSFDVREDVVLPGADIVLPTVESVPPKADPVTPQAPADKNEKEFALQRRKKKVKANVPPVETPIYHPIFDGEIKVSLKENKDMLNIIGNENACLEYLRILPWGKLIDSFWSGKICIWAKDKPSSPLLCNSAGYFPPKNFISITKVTRRSEIINWIITGSLPSDRPRDLMHLILTPKNMHFLIAGYCLKKISQDSTPSETQSDFLNKWSTSAAEISSSSSFMDVDDVDVESPEDRITFSESGYRDTIHSNPNQQSLLRDNRQEKDASRVSSPEVQISVMSQPLSPVTKRFKIVKPKIMKLPEKRSPTDSTPVELSSRKNLTITKPTSQTPRKGIGSRDRTTKITTKRTYVKVGSVFNSLQSVANTNDLSNVSTPTIKQILNTPPCTVNTSAVNVLDDSRVDSALSTRSDDNENLSVALNNLLEKSMMLENNSGEKECGSPPRRNSQSMSVEKELATAGCNSKKERVPKTVSDKEVVPQDLLKLTEVDEPPRKSTGKQKQLSVRSNESSPKKITKDPLAITETGRLASRPQKSVTSSPESKGDTQFTKRTRTSSDSSSVSKNRITSQSGVIPSRSLKCTHKDMNNQSKTLVLTNKVFNHRKLYFTKDDVKGTEINIALPSVSKNCKWRMIYLNSDFSFLTFVTVNYSIKYTDLLDVVKMSSNIKSTITLRNKEFSDTFKHPLFGIYCVPDYQDRLFIGPYASSEKHSVETLRYLQGRLIDTQIFNKMVGRNVSEKNPVWLYESPPRPISLPNGLVIDITEDDEAHEVTVVDLDSDSSEEAQDTTSKSQVSTSKVLENSLLFPPFVEELTQDELKSRHSINRYIMTNIPHLGYFDARQRDSKAIEVFWPDGSRGYRFPNVTFAKNLLTRYLYQIFCPIPRDFKINVIIMTNLGVQINKPINSKYLSRSDPYICGEFGVYEKDAIPDDLLKKHNVSSIESLLQWHEEVQNDEDAMIRIFGLFLMSNEELRKHSEPYKILQWAISETYILKKLAENYESEKVDLQNMIRAKTQKIKEKRKDIRTDETPDSTRMNVSETIEIQDSDEEDNQKTNTEAQTPSFKRISISGRIDTDSVYDQSQSRSILKSNVWIKPGRSLLKSNDKKTQKVASPEKLTSIEPVKISLNNSNIVLNKNNLLITKLK